MATARIFLSFDPPDAIVAHLSALQKRLRGLIPGVAWVPTHQFHATITFLGSVDEMLLPELIREVSVVTSVSPSFDVSYEGLGVFPPSGPPEVLWVGCVNPDGRLASLKKALDDAIRRLGIEVPRSSFHPHVTLGRIRRKSVAGDLIPMLESLTLEPRRTYIGEIFVVKSTLSAQGAHHSVLATNPLQPSELSA